MPVIALRWHTDPLYPLFHPSTKWLGEGKPFDYAQQNINSRALPKCHRWVPETPQVSLGGTPWHPPAAVVRGLVTPLDGRPPTWGPGAGLTGGHSWCSDAASRPAAAQ